jgi:hypothetical protein
MGQDYFLSKIYEQMSKDSPAANKSINKYSLASLYEAVVQNEKNQEDVQFEADPNFETELQNQTTQKKKQSKPVTTVTTPEQSYDNVIANALFGNKDAIDQIPQPKGNYMLGVSTHVNEQDKNIYTKLFPLTPPKKGSAISDVGTKGSGNGEIALYWLLSKHYQVKDNRDAGKPDLAVIQKGNEVGVEVKAYDAKKIGLGRFGDQKDNRNVLSIAFGLKALLAGLSNNAAKRTPSLDTFNKEELTSAFHILSIFDKNEALRELSAEFLPIQEIYKQIDYVKEKLQLKEEYTPEQGAANMLLAFLSTKLKEKPGFGGYMANVKNNGEITFHQIPSEEDLKNIEPKKILDNVNANGAALLINLENLLKTKL